VSRNARTQFVKAIAALGAIWLACASFQAADWSWNSPTSAMAKVVSVEDQNAISDFQPDNAVVQRMVNCGLTNFTGKATVTAAWLSLISTQDVIGIKVFSEPGMLSGTRPAVVAAVVHSLLDAGLPATNIIIWDKHADDLRAAGFFQLAAKLGVRAVGALESGYDPTNFYLPDSPIIGNLVWGDLEFGKKGPDVGKRSFVSKLVSRQITKIISIVPLLNQDSTGVCGHLYSLAMGSVDNTMRFESDPARLAVAVPEIYALPALGDRVVLNITDALIGQYEGGPQGLLQYSSVMDQLWFSHDPVALDVLAIKELQQRRRLTDSPKVHPDLDLYTNAALLQLGVDDPAKIQVKKIQIK
jgi:hypothetical protein